MKILSPITHHNSGSRNLQKTLIKYGYNFDFVGIGYKWVNYIENKIKKILEYLLNAENDLYCVIDGYDVLACNYPSELIKKYIEHGNKIIFGGEKFGFSYNAIPIKKYGQSSFLKSRKYLNSGFYIGRRDDLIQMCQWAIKASEKLAIYDDQKILCVYANSFPEKVGIDLYQNFVFNTITSIDTTSFEKKGEIIYIAPFRTYPCFIHFPSIKSDGYERYNKYGKAILGKKFFPIFGERTWNFFANMPLYLVLILSTYLLAYIVYGKKGLLFLTTGILAVLKIYVSV